MTDWAYGIENRNYGIRCVTDLRNMSDLLLAILSLAAVAGSLLFSLWIRSQIVNIGYDSLQLAKIEQSLQRTEKSLILEEETLKSPGRIDSIARNDLKMIPLRPNQLILPQIQEMDSNASDDLAMVDSGAVPQTAGIHPEEQQRLWERR